MDGKDININSNINWNIIFNLLVPIDNNIPISCILSLNHKISINERTITPLIIIEHIIIFIIYFIPFTDSNTSWNMPSFFSIVYFVKSIFNSLILLKDILDSSKLSEYTVILFAILLFCVLFNAFWLDS